MSFFIISKFIFNDSKNPINLVVKDSQRNDDEAEKDQSLHSRNPDKKRAAESLNSKNIRKELSSEKRAEIEAQKFLRSLDVPFSHRECIITESENAYIYTYPPPENALGGDFVVKVSKLSFEILDARIGR